MMNVHLKRPLIYEKNAGQGAAFQNLNKHMDTCKMYRTFNKLVISLATRSRFKTIFVVFQYSFKTKRYYRYQTLLEH